MATIIVKQVRSRINASKVQKATLDALGLRHINQEVKHNDTPQIRGMVAKINHLVEMRENDN